MKHLGSKILKGTVILASCLTFGVLLFLIAYILIKGLPNLSPKLFSLHYTTENVSMLPAIINTIEMTLCSTYSCSTARNMYCYIPCRICEKGQQGCRYYKAYRRNAFGNTVNRIWFVRNVVLCNVFKVGIFNTCRCGNVGNNGTSAYYENNRRGTSCSIRFIS